MDANFFIFQPDNRKIKNVQANSANDVNICMKM